MKFRDLGGNTGSMATPYRIEIPERGVTLSYGSPDRGAVVFIETEGSVNDDGMETGGRAVFGTNGEAHHESLKGRLEDGEQQVLRGVYWPKYKAVSVWQTFSSISEMHELFGCLAGAIQDEFGDSPSDVCLYLSYSFRDYSGNHCFNVVLTLAEAASLKGYGDCKDYFAGKFKEEHGYGEEDGKDKYSDMGYWMESRKGNAMRLTENDVRMMVYEAVRKVLDGRKK